MPLTTSTDGDRLHCLVGEYAAIGHHRTGTDEDARTRAWLCDQLLDRGVAPVQVPYGFLQFTVEHHHVTIDGQEVESLALWYAGDGDHDTDTVLRQVAPFVGGGIGTADLSVDANDPNSSLPAVVATTGIGGRLGVPNRAPSTSPTRPVALVPGRFAPSFAGARVTYSARLRRHRGGSANVLASFGNGPGDPVIVTTPITGWFACAGERGTGLAIALDLAEELQGEHPVIFAGTTGHEIGYLGVEALLASGHLGRPHAIVHVGASIAAGVPRGDELGFSNDRHALTTMGGEPLARLKAAVADAAFSTARDPASWLGEGQVLKRLSSPMLSFLGGFPLFHTSDDLPELATSPELLVRARAGVLGGSRVLLDSLGAVPATELVG